MTEPCPVCGDAAPRHVPGPAMRWRYVACRACHHRWLLPQPSVTELAAYYNSAYSVDRAAYERAVVRERPPLLSLLAAARPDRPPGRMLEIGCSYGGMLAAFRGDGWTVEGIETDARAVAVATGEHGLRVWEGRLETVADRLSPPYDMIAIYHVIEHITDPWSFMARLRTLMAHDGTLIIRTPNARALAARLAAGWWQWAAPPEHVHLFSPMSLRHLLEHTGFDVRHLATRRGDASGTGFELIRAAAKCLSRHRPASAGASVGAAAANGRRPRVPRSVERVIDVLTRPLDVAVARRSLASPELVITAAPRHP